MGNLPESTQNTTAKYFNNIFNEQKGISQNINDSLVSYFEQYSQSKQSAEILSQVVIDTAAAQNTDPMLILSQFQKLSENELNTLLTLFLNSQRIPTSLLGVKNRPVTSPYVLRAILF